MNNILCLNKILRLFLVHYNNNNYYLFIMYVRVPNLHLATVIVKCSQIPTRYVR